MSDHTKALEYATKVFNQVKSEWDKMSYAEENDSQIVTFKGHSDYFQLEFGEHTPWSFWMTLHDGYWAVETCINDYMINYPMTEDTASEVYIVPFQCKFICKTLGQPEAWICFEDRLNNSSDAPEAFVEIVFENRKQREDP